MTTVGVISDTHGLLRPGALEEMRGSDLILHIGDVGDPGILDQLRELAPVHAVRGNVDRDSWAEALPLTEVVEVGGVVLYLIHILNDLDLDPEAAGFDAVIFGHTHRPRIDRAGPVMYLNPGSAGPRRVDLPITVAKIRIEDGVMDPEIIELG